jgi:5-amino-6-(5-phospho-D-ribitylamino)uracil phosphatase
VRSLLDIPRSQVLAVGDGRNDVDMLTWAAEFGRGIAMGQAPAEVKAIATSVAASVLDDGLAQVLARIVN